ncbi:MAG: DUF2225 domain-containing protein [Agathobacter sp.]|nr:DUF2225 domain-containing protein [Agathobacter sp.]
MRTETIAQLKKISTPKQFPKDEYICYEGQPGEEMYIILKGSVGIFLTNSMGTLNQVATMTEGGFFGEMAIFDNLPRSASCIALENTLCVAVNKDNLKQFLVTCPDIAIQMLNNMSGRVRKLNDDLYKSNRVAGTPVVEPFQIPKEYGFRHVVKEPYHAPQFLVKNIQYCPICGKSIETEEIKRHVLQMRNIDLDSRITYVGCEPLWKEVISCPHCYYSNHYLRFFQINDMEKDLIKKVLKDEHRPVIEEPEADRSEFDYLVLRYLQAIHINELINSNANAWIGGMWRNLYWLMKDAMDERFALYCAEKAIEKLKNALNQNEIFDNISRGSIALSVGSMLIFCGRPKEAVQYIDTAIECPDEHIRNNAKKVNEKL